MKATARRPLRLPAGPHRRSRLRRWPGRPLTFLVLVSGLLLGHSAAVGQEEADAPGPGGRQEPRPIEVSNVWFPFSVAKEGLRQNGAWLPIYVELKNLSGREELATLEVSSRSRFGKENAQTFVVRKTADVPPGAPRRVWVNMRAAPSDQQLITLRVTVAREDGATGARRDVVVYVSDLGSADSHDLSASGDAIIAALVVGTSVTQVIPRPDWFRLSQFGNQSALVQDQCEPSVLPDTLLGYQPFDVVVIRDFGEERLEPAQITALRHWVFMGGFVVLTASTPAGDLLRSELARVLLGDEYAEPVTDALTLGEDLPPGAIIAVHQNRRALRTSGDSDVIVKQRALALLEPQSLSFVDPVTEEPEANRRSWSVYMLSEDESQAVEEGGRSIRLVDRSPVTLEGARRMYVELRSGRGRVGVLTFGDQSLGPQSESAFVAPIWRRILGSGHGGSPLSRRAAAFAEDGVVKELRDPARDIGFSFIVALVVIYLLLIGPGVYFLLKRLDRLPSLIWVEPLVVVLYLAVVIIAGYVSKGAITKAREWTLISQRVGDDLAVRESYLAVFAGAERDYQIGSAAGILLKPIFANREEAAAALSGARDGAPSLVLEEDSVGHRRLTGLHLKQWAEGYAVNLDVMEVDPGGAIQVEVLGDLRSRNQQSAEMSTLRVRLANLLPYAIRTGVYVHPSEGEFLLPPVAAGATVEVPLQRRRDESAELPGNLNDLLELARRHGFDPRGRRPDLAAFLDRPDADYDEEWNSNLRERLDLFLLYRTD